ncbi:MAG: murein biosynthesis integral membrane protein MurJ [bacterium]|nr:murein biosynthesis integral membrane protein MurJ [bacterium]
MNKILNKTKDFIFSKQSSIFSSAMLLSFMIIISRVFGFLRYRILASYFPTNQLDIFFASFRIPDLVFEILITGALTSSFIPIFIKYQKNKEELKETISSIINLIFLLMIIFIIVIFISLDFIMPLITPGYSQEKIALIIFYSRILLIGQLPFMVLGNFLTGIGQSNKTFFLSAIAPIIYNLAIIIFTIFFASSFYLLAPMFGVIIGAALMFIIQTPLLFRSDFTYGFYLKKTKGLIEFIRIIIPRAFTVIVAQIDATIDLTLTTFLGNGAYTYFYLAQHLQLLPVSVIGMAFGQASLPYLSEIYRENKIEEFKSIIVDSILNLFFFTIPIMSFFIFARTPLVRLFFGGQQFDWDSTVQTAITMSYFSLSLPFHTIYYFLTRSFYALMDSRTPFYISIFSILLNTILSLLFVFVFKFPVWALAISFSVSMIVNVIMLLIILSIKLHGLNFRYLFTESIKMLIATGIPSVIVYYLMKVFDTLILDTSRTINIFFLILINGIIYVLLYLFLSWILDVKEIFMISKFILKAKEYHKKIIEIYSDYE